MSGKPPGIGIHLRDGALCYGVTPIDRVADCIWDAVREAINSNMTAEQFKREAAQAWESHLADDAKAAVEEFRK